MIYVDKIFQLSETYQKHYIESDREMILNDRVFINKFHKENVLKIIFSAGIPLVSIGAAILVAFCDFEVLSWIFGGIGGIGGISAFQSILKKLSE